MDLRDIQRLHAQFASDSMTIDLPRQIAAVPAPADLAADDRAPTMKVRLPKAAPTARQTLVAVAIAAVVGMAGMGAASLYKSLGAPSVHTARPASGEGKLAAIEQTVAPATHPIDAEPPHPVAVAPMLTAKDLAPSGVGLTADQFRNSLGSNAPAVDATPSKAAPVSTEEQRAAASPIHQARRDADATQQPAANSPAMKAAAPAAQSAGQQPTTSATTATPAATTQATDGATTETSTPSHSHSYRHHAKRARDEQTTESDGAAASNKKVAPATRGGSNEVQMF
ncbi:MULTISPECIES: hypothetical protein [unclassified Caballeronia]|uniref:hypothetical protein n=1 Tax=unclassified Caballeronia TaxID=2646786 RepID=UPI002866C519|nr:MULTISPECIES: hypothetical protein [unclassified Caballeronia]MDR5776398.1 hypothetical protein [Caballeronia sp. LZ002]MDR5851820.1 hypothetical protein [Caballeronia sp. LZ003]